MLTLQKAFWTGLLGLLVLFGCAPQSGPLLEQSLTDTPQHGKFIWHDLITDDVDGARAFYGPLMGWTFEDTRRPGGGAYTLIVSSAGRYVGGIVELQDPDNGQDYSRWLGYFAVASVDAAVATTRESGGEVIVGPRNLANVARVAAVRDPDGAVVGLVTSKVGFPRDVPLVAHGEIVWNELLAVNPSSVADFYTSLSSGTLTATRGNDEAHYLLQDNGLNRAGVMQRPDAQLEPLWLTFFAAGDAALGADKAADLGGTVLLAPDAEVRGGSMALIVDPAGAVFGLQRRDQRTNK